MKSKAKAPRAKTTENSNYFPRIAELGGPEYFYVVNDSSSKIESFPEGSM